MKQLSSRKYNTRLRALIQRTGRLCFTEETAAKMGLTENSGIGVAEDEETNELFLVVRSTVDDDCYELCKSSRYLYAHTSLFFDEIGLDYVHNDIVLEFIRIDDHDGIEGDVYKICIKTKKGGPLKRNSTTGSTLTNIQEAAAKQRVTMKLWNFIDKTLLTSKPRWCVLDDYPLTDEPGGLSPDLTIYNDKNTPEAFIFIVDNKEEASATRKIDAALRTHELIEAFLYNFESNTWKSNVKKAKTPSESRCLSVDFSQAFESADLAATVS